MATGCQQFAELVGDHGRGETGEDGAHRAVEIEQQGLGGVQDAVQLVGVVDPGCHADRLPAPDSLT
ncbi:hypothetical protein GCM10010452_16670 [Crossiella cryophila]